MDTDKGWGSSQLFLAAKKTGIYSKLITEASFVVVGEQQAPPRNALSFSSWMSVLARPVRRSACGFLLVLAEPRRVMRSKPSHGRPAWGAGCPVPCGRENTPQRVAAKPQETLYLQTFLQDPRFLFMVSFNSGGSGIVRGKKKNCLISALLISLPKLACITL